MRKIWIDLDNPPHVLLFKPLIHDLTSRGHRVLVTARDHAYTCELLDEEKIPFQKVGRSYGKNILMKIFGTLIRAIQLIVYIRNQNPGIAVSHGSRSLVLASFFLSIPSITLFDYEFVHSGIFNRFSTKILIPELVDERPLLKQGLPAGRLVKYPGIKEEIYLDKVTGPRKEKFSFIRDGKINVLIRPAAETAHYHHASSERILEKILSHLVKQDSVNLILSPRTPEQYIRFKKMYGSDPKVTVLEKPVNGLSLIRQCDLVIGGGGTMNREAALLGVPVYSTFLGPKGSVDGYLESKRKLTFIRSDHEIDMIKLEKRKIGSGMDAPSPKVREFILNQILEMK